MADISVLNTDSDLSAQTLLTAEGSHTVTGSQTFDRDPNPPFVVTSGSAVVTNLDSDKVDGKHSTDLLLLDGTQSMSAALNLGATGQLVFPAVQNASAGVNTLDDYEEGTFTPTIVSSGGGTPTYSLQFGNYTKVGNRVYYSINVLLATTGTLAAGTVTIAGLPFTASASQYSGAAIGFWGGMTTNITNMTAYIAPSTSALIVSIVTIAAAAVTAMQVANISGTLNIVVSGHYNI